MNEPKTIDEVVFKTEIEKEKITDITSMKKPFPIAGVNGIILYGIYGTGKTTLAKLLPEAIEKTKGGDDVDSRFVRCIGGENGIALINKLSTQASFVQIANKSGFHYFVLDEVDLLTENAMKQLKGLMNLPSTIFIMTTNFINQIDKGVINRSILVDFNAAESKQWLPIAHQILDERMIKGVSDANLISVIEKCEGSARQIIDAISSVAAKSKRNSLYLVKN